MSRYGRDSERQAFSYMDDVPVKISEQYKPPRKVTLPVSYQQRLAVETVTEVYDFNLENSVLQKMGEWRKLRKSAVQKRAERIKAQDRPSSKSQEARVVTSNSSVSPAPSPYSTLESSSGSYPNCTDSNVSYSNPQPSFTNPNSLTSSSLAPALQSISYSNPRAVPTPQYSILTPVPIAPSSAYTDTNKTLTHFNFSDFEADTSSPFDNMELKTINEMEELAHVLQPLSNTPNQIKQKPPDLEVALSNCYSNPVSVYNVDQVALCNMFDSKLTKKNPAVHTHINGLTDYGIYGTAPRLKEQSVRNNDYVNMVQSYDYSTIGMPQKSESSYPYCSEQTWTANVNAVHVNSCYLLDSAKRTNNIVTSENSVVGHHPSVACTGSVQQSIMVEGPGYATHSSTIHHPPLTYGASFPSTCNFNQDQQSPGRSLSKSVPDIVQELEKELKNKRAEDSASTSHRSSHTPPPRPNSFGSTGLENWKPWPDLDSPEQPQHGTKSNVYHHKMSKVTLRSSMPNPFPDLNPNAQKLVKHISEMGFSLPRAARACQLLGEDDKKIVEFLLQVQSLEEKNYPSDQVEKAFVKNRFHMDDTIKYLDAMAQLMGLGFPEDRVSEALLKFDNDRDKALDQLIS